MSPCARRTLAAALLVGTLSGSGCAYHVELAAPPAMAPLPEREAAYARLRPVRLAETHVRFFDRIFARRQRFVDYVQLADGTAVEMPEDILPVVRPDSVAALAVEESLAARQRRRLLRITGALALIGGASTMIAAIDVDTVGARRALLIGGGVAIGAGLGLRIGSRYAHQREEDGARRAFLAFDAGLRGYLDVCPDGDLHGVCAPPGAEPRWERPVPGWEQAR